jgi:uncharacterized protein (DUF983 family)
MNLLLPGGETPVSIPNSGGSRFAVCMRRAITRSCPYCGRRGVFKSYFSLKDRCPHCNVKYAYEDGFFLGSYVINIGFTELVTVLFVVWMIAALSLSVLQMQIIGVTMAVALPILFYPIALLMWIALDITLHDPGDFSRRVRQ